MSDKYSRPRPNALLLFEAHRKLVAYRLALVGALRELDVHNCMSCRRASYVIEGVDRVAERDTPAPAIPAQRVDPDYTPGDSGLTMTTFDVACAFGVDERTVKGWILADKIPSFLDDKGRRRFDTATIDALLA